MVRVRDFENLRIDEGKVRANWDSVIEKPWVLQRTVLAIDIFFIECPANTLSCTTLELPFDIIRVDCLARVLNNSVANNAG